MNINQSMENSSKKTTYQWVLKEVEDSKGPYLPAMAKIAQKYGIPRQEILHACSRLRDEKILQFNRGSRILINSKANESDYLKRERKFRSHEKIFQELLENIKKGLLQTGDALPKVLYYSQQKNISHHTVSNAYQELEKQGYIHKVGKRWFVGKSTLDNQSTSLKTAPSNLQEYNPSALTLFIIGDKELSYRELFYSERLHKFAEFLQREVEKHAIHIQYLYFETTQLYSCGKIFRIHDWMRIHHNRYLGSLFFCHQTPENISQPVARELLRLKKPVVWFDPAHFWKRPNIEGKNFTFAHFSEDSAIEVAASTLHSRGHVNVGYYDAFNVPWSAERFEKLNAALKQKDSRSSVIRIVPKDVVDNPGRYSFETNPSFYNLMKNGHISVLVSANDDKARVFWSKLMHHGIEVPKHISLLSFDNNRNISHLPICTIDFGFGNLAYKIFHLILQDLPVKVSKNGDLVAQAFLLDRGSLAYAKARERIK